MDDKMTDRSMRWRVDASPDHSLKEEQYRHGSAFCWPCMASKTQSSRQSIDRQRFKDITNKK